MKQHKRQNKTQQTHTGLLEEVSSVSSSNDEEKGNGNCNSVSRRSNLTVDLSKHKEEENSQDGGSSVAPPVSKKKQQTKVDNRSQEWVIMLTMQENLNIKIGVQTYKKNLNAAFWNYISTPINFIITLFTALSAGQTASNLKILSQTQMFYVLFASFVLSTVNIFFKLKEKAILNHDAAKQYEMFGLLFDEIYYRPLNTDADVKAKIADYTKLNRDIEKYTMSETIDSVNYATELIFKLVKTVNYKNGFHGGKYYGEKRLNRNERVWFLDGQKMDTEYYKNNYEIGMDGFAFEFDTFIPQPPTQTKKTRGSFNTPRIGVSQMT